MLRWTKLGGGQKETASSTNGSSSGPQVGPDGLTDQERQALEEMDRFYGMENVSLSPFSFLSRIWVELGMLREQRDAEETPGGRRRRGQKALQEQREALLG
jgi:hypothetical protein